MKRILLSVAAVAVATAAMGQQYWTLGDCIEYALEQNIALQQRQVQVDNQKIQLQTTQFSRLPMIQGSISENYNIGRAQNREGVYEDRGSATTSMGANASVTVFQGLRIHNQAKADKLSLEAATEDLEQARQDLSINITAAYLQVLYTKENEKVAQRQVDISTELLERTKKMVSAGRSSQSELYDAESALASAQSSLVDAVNSRQTAILDLAQAMNYTDYSSLDVQTPVVENLLDEAMIALNPVDSIYSDYITRRPSVQAAQKRLQQAERQVKVAQASYYPSINFGASYNTGYYSAQALAGGTGSFWQQLSQNGSPSFGLSMSVPIFSRMQVRNSVRTARNAVKTQQLSLDQERLTVYKEVQQAYVNAKAAYGKYLSGLKSEEAARKAFEFEQKKFDSGRSTAYQYNEVGMKLANASAQLAQAKYSFILRVKILDFYKGEPLY